MTVVRAAGDNTHMASQSPSDRRGQTVTVTVAFSLTCILLCLFTRLYMRWPWSKMISKKTDGLAVASTLFAIAQAASLEVAVSNGLGHPVSQVSDQHKSSIRTSLLVTNLLFFLSAAFASMAVVEFIIALKGPMKIWVLDNVLRYVSPVWGLAGIIVYAVFLGLTSTHVPAAAAIVFGVLGCLMHLSTFSAAAFITMGLQTDRMTKARVLLGFSPSILVVGAFIASMAVVPSNLLDKQTFTTADVDYFITLQAILLFSIIYATTPALMQIGKRFQTGYNAPVIGENGNTMSGSINRSMNKKGRSQDDSYGLKSFGNGNHQIVSTISTHDKAERDHYRSHSERARRERTAKQQPGADGDGLSMASDSSQKIIISKSITQSSVNV